MMTHLLRIVWNRKGRNFLIALEIFFSFLVVFFVALVTLHFIQNWRAPLGFGYERVWRIDPRPPSGGDDAAAANDATVQRLMAALADLPNIEAVGVSAGGGVPYSGSEWGGNFQLLDGREVQYTLTRATDSFADVMGIQVVAGRWFSREDDGAAIDPVVINRRLAAEMFGDRDPIGQNIPEDMKPRRDGSLPEPKRVIGVVSEYRKNGELSTPGLFLFYREAFRRDENGGDNPEIAIRVTPGTTAQFEETLATTLRNTAPDWTFEIGSLETARETWLRLYATPLIIGGTLAAFLLMMVALGLIGVVWQNVTERTREFGLRRAKGATVPNVQHQVLIELALLASMAVALALALVLQLPVLPLPPDVWVFTTGEFAAAIAVTAAVIYCLTLLCGWYPSRLATRIQPAEALHYE
jgi:putative ABC transport system permease protein